MSTDIAALEILGPNPAQMVRYMAAMAKKDGHDIMTHQISRTWDEISGAGGEVGKLAHLVFSASQSTRDILRSAQMGSAVLSAIVDFATVRATTSWNGLSTTKTLARYFSLMNPANAEDRQLARDMGLVMEAVMMGAKTAHVSDNDLGRGFAARFANATFEASGLNATTTSPPCGSMERSTTIISPS
jgi:hypothetical protein